MVAKRRIIDINDLGKIIVKYYGINSQVIIESIQYSSNQREYEEVPLGVGSVCNITIEYDE